MDKYLITYKNNKHCYVKIDKGKLHIILPKMLKKNKQEHDKILNILLKKGINLLKKHQKKTFLEVNNKNNLSIRGKKVSNFFLDGENIDNFLKIKLYNYIKPRVESLSTKLGFKNIKIRINRVKSKRGSCSYDNKLMFNLLLIHLPKKYTDYVIVHECCHFIYKNHSKEFWNLVGEYYPEYKNIKNEMKLFKFNI